MPIQSKFNVYIVYKQLILTKVCFLVLLAVQYAFQNLYLALYAPVLYNLGAGGIACFLSPVIRLV